EGIAPRDERRVAGRTASLRAERCERGKSKGDDNRAAACTSEPDHTMASTGWPGLLIYRAPTHRGGAMVKCLTRCRRRQRASARDGTLCALSVLLRRNVMPSLERAMERTRLREAE